ncbi:protein of unknown function DUF324 [Thermovibrio ammonificans HB-1]|uniref:CRISPR system Cms protein Csm4 n=1 Tax=Thermovibrio ammonificans (strain DSM 15698 / JCM 12110 / HB-1) TaxID=648996 RepID=E8T6Q2_THEA1|nr:RAMP superfamily CRISPR-associated protein [Thermovibrio ammonificans]ADU96836.1 protein of unknown function DUF324 [Thermovibrio ammonificans HB-1]
MVQYIYLDFTLKPDVFSSVPLSDTIFGEFCWLYRFIHGERKLKELLNSEEPPVAFSNFMPQGAVPVPKAPLTLTIFDIESYSLAKKFKKIPFVREELLKKAAKGVSDPITLNNRLFEHFKKSVKLENKTEEDFPKLVKNKTSRQRVKVARISSLEEGGLFNQNELFLNEKVRLIVAVHSSLKEEIKEIVRLMGEIGIGQKKSLGYGSFKVVSVEYWKNELSENAENWFISLSTGLPRKEEIEDGFADFGVKYPKHGPEISAYGYTVVFKKPVIFSRAGSVFKGKVKKPVYGSLLEGKSVIPEHKHPSFIVPLFI